MVSSATAPRHSSASVVFLTHCGGGRVLWSDDFYAPWRTLLFDASAEGMFNGRQIETTEIIRADTKWSEQGYVLQLSQGIREFSPDAVCLSVVTQGGTRLPWQAVIRQVCAENECPPTFVLDGCQAFCRVPHQLPVALEAEVLYVFCLHKAVRGPRAMAGLCTNSERIAEWIAPCWRRVRGGGTLSQYVRTGGAMGGVTHRASRSRTMRCRAISTPLRFRPVRSHSSRGDRGRSRKGMISSRTPTGTSPLRLRVGLSEVLPE